MRIARRTASWLCLPCGTWLGQQFGDGLSLLAREMAGEISREERIGFRAGDGFLHMVAMFRSGTGKGEESGGKLHLGIIAAELNGLLYESVAVDSGGWILGIFAEPLFVGFREIARIKIVESRRRAG